MIEVELKFVLSKEQKDLLLSNANFLCQETHTDVYYDSEDYSLSLKDFWLRKRNDKFTLKIPATTKDSVKSFQKKIVPKYEIEDEDEIKKIFQITSNERLETALKESKYMPLYQFSTTRSKYEKNGFIIDIDISNFDNNLSYEICEIELIVNDEGEVNNALQKIKNFAQEHSITMQTDVEGKIYFYIRHKNREHLNLLINKK